jgi:hypothetical protein
MMPGEIGTGIWVGKWSLQHGRSAEERPEEFYQFRPQNPGIYKHALLNTLNKRLYLLAYV